MKKFTLANWKEFCKEALILPPFDLEDGAKLQEWFDTHKIHIIANDCEIEIEYYADAVEEVEYCIQEIYEAIYGEEE